MWRKNRNRGCCLILCVLAERTLAASHEKKCFKNICLYGYRSGHLPTDLLPPCLLSANLAFSMYYNSRCWKCYSWDYNFQKPATKMVMAVAGGTRRVVVKKHPKNFSKPSPKPNHPQPNGKYRQRFKIPLRFVYIQRIITLYILRG